MKNSIYLLITILISFMSVNVSCNTAKIGDVDGIVNYKASGKYMTIDNFNKIKNYVILNGEEVIWSSLYGKGIRYEFDHIEVIYTPAAKVGERINAPWTDFLVITVFDQNGAASRSEGKYSYKIVNKGKELEVYDMSAYYYGVDVNQKVSIETINDLFMKLLDMID